MTFDDFKSDFENRINHARYAIFDPNLNKKTKKTKDLFFWINVKNTIISREICHFEIACTKDGKVFLDEEGFNEKEHFINLELHFEDYHNNNPSNISKLQSMGTLFGFPIENRDDKYVKAIKGQQIGIIFASYKADSLTLISDLLRDLESLNLLFFGVVKDIINYLYKC